MFLLCGEKKVLLRGKFLSLGLSLIFLHFIPQHIKVCLSLKSGTRYYFSYTQDLYVTLKVLSFFFSLIDFLFLNENYQIQFLFLEKFHFFLCNSIVLKIFYFLFKRIIWSSLWMSLINKIKFCLLKKINRQCFNFRCLFFNWEFCYCWGSFFFVFCSKELVNENKHKAKWI